MCLSVGGESGSFAPRPAGRSAKAGQLCLLTPNLLPPSVMQSLLNYKAGLKLDASPVWHNGVFLHGSPIRGECMVGGWGGGVLQLSQSQRKEARMCEDEWTKC